MGLFEVPGWSVPPDAVHEKPSTPSRKRKRPSIDSSDSKFKSAEANIDKIVQKLRGVPVAGEKDSSVTSPKPGQVLKNAFSKHVDRKREKKSKVVEEKKRMISHPMPLHATSKPRTIKDSRKASDDISVSSTKSSPHPPQKKVKTLHDPSLKSVSFAPQPQNQRRSSQIDGDRGLTPLQKSMKQSLSGARFRMINENLYKNNSKSSLTLMSEDPDMFNDYHEGFRHQVASWPTNPVETYIAQLRTRPTGTLIVDLGCGDAALAKELVPLGLSVLSFDLVSDGMYVIQADICDHLPLPGSEGVEGTTSEGDGHVVDVVVCALSLMGTNWLRTIREAWRVLKTAGELRIAEVASRFTDVGGFVQLIESLGFELRSKDESNTHFTLFNFDKVARAYKSDKEWQKIEDQSAFLKPCEYKRR